MPQSTPRSNQRIGLVPSYEVTKVKADSGNPSCEDSFEDSQGNAFSGDTRSISQDDCQHPFKPDEIFYFEDGDIFVVAGNILFCVHREKLAFKGGKLAYLAEPAVHPATTEIIYGLPLIKFPELSAREMRFLLAHIYGRIKLRRTMPDGSDWLFWDAAISLLEVSHTLDLSSVRQVALWALSCLFPTSTKPNTFYPTIGGLRPARYIIFQRSFPFKAISVFRKTGVDAMLPMAFYHAAQMSTTDIVTGVMDGSELLKLSERDTLIVLEGRDNLRTSRRRVLFFWISCIITDYGPLKASSKCTSSRQSHGIHCYGFLRELFIAWDGARYLEGHNALETLSSHACDVIQEHICSKCWEEVSRMIDVGLDINWERLPIYFGLPKREKPEAEKV